MARAGAPHRKALLAGGGTGGHVYPALALASVLRRRRWSVMLAGLAEGMEATLAAQHDLPFHPLRARAVVGRGPLGKLGALATLAVSAMSVRNLIRRSGVRVVVGTGGYVSAPAVLGAWLAGRPALLFEPNARAGAANRWLSRWAAEAAVAYSGAARDLRCPVRETGIPVRPEFFAARDAPPVEGRLRLLVLGGSQGARQLNELVPRALERIAETSPPLVVVHQTGALHRAAVAHDYAARSLGDVVRVEIVPYIDDVASALREAHLVVSRAGAITLAELCAVGRAAVLLPLALAGGHQAENARRLEAAGGALLVQGEEATPDGLAAVLSGLLGDVDRLRRMGAALLRLGHPDAAERLADRVEALGEAA